MFKKKLFLLVICLLNLNLFSLPASADEQSSPASAASSDNNQLLVLPQTIVTANRMPVPADEVGRSVSVRTDEEFKQRHVTTLSEGVQDVSGVRVEQLGGPGAPGVARLEIRGFPSRGTQLMLNGLKLDDPTSISGTYESFVSFMSMQDIERVEVLKGGAGVLYGSDSQGGVVNMLTFSPQDGASASASFEGGSYNTYTETALFNVGNERGGVMGSLYRIDSQGLSANSDYSNTTFSAVGSYDLVPDKLTVAPIFRILDATIDIGTGPSVDANGSLVPSQDTPNNDLEGQSYITGATAKVKHTDKLESTADIYVVNSDRRYYYEFSGVGSESEFKGSSFNTDLQASYDIEELNSNLSVGSSLTHQEYHTYSDEITQRAQRNQVAGFIYDRTHFLGERLQLAAGARITYISDIDKNVPTFEASAVYKIPEVETRLHSSVAQGFRAPTLFESEGTMVDFNTGQVVSVGNPNLDEEKALTFDIGAGQDLWSDKLTADVTYFHTQADKTIIFDFPNETHINGSGGQFYGIESSILARPTEWFYLRGSYTNQAKADQGDGVRAPRRPYNWYALTGVTELGKLKFVTEIRYRSSQELEFFGAPQRVEEEGVTLCNVAATYQLDKHLSVFLRGDNIFDVKYTDGGYDMPAASVFGGLRIDLS